MHCFARKTRLLVSLFCSCCVGSRTRKEDDSDQHTEYNVSCKERKHGGSAYRSGPLRLKTDTRTTGRGAGMAFDNHNGSHNKEAVRESHLADRGDDVEGRVGGGTLVGMSACPHPQPLTSSHHSGCGGGADGGEGGGGSYQIAGHGSGGGPSNCSADGGCANVERDGGDVAGEAAGGAYGDHAGTVGDDAEEEDDGGGAGTLSEMVEGDDEDDGRGFSAMVEGDDEDDGRGFSAMVGDDEDDESEFSAMVGDDEDEDEDGHVGPRMMRPMRLTSQTFAQRPPYNEPRFTAPFRDERKQLDYDYHAVYERNRQQLQDGVLEYTLGVEVDACDRPLIVFLGGPVSSGKTYTAHWLLMGGHIPFSSFIYVDPDAIKEMLPECKLARAKKTMIPSELTHVESGYISEIAVRAAMKKNCHIIVDGTLKSFAWHAQNFRNLKALFPHYRCVILDIRAREETVLARAQSRARLTQRDIPPAVMRQSLVDVPVAMKHYETLPEIDFIAHIDNDGVEPVMVTPGSFEELTLCFRRAMQS